MSVGGEKLPQARRGERNRVGSNDAGDIETCRPRRGDQFRLERAEI